MKFSIMEILNKRVSVITKKDETIVGELVLYGMNDKTIALRDYELWSKDEKGLLKITDKGKIIIIKRDAWVMIKAKM